MKKFLLSTMAALFVLSMNAQDSSSNVQTEEEKVLNIVDLLHSVEGYVFITRGEQRDLSQTFTRTDEVFEGASDHHLRNMSWSAYDNNVLKVYDDGVIEGLHYGKTLLTVVDNAQQTHYFIVFVCPTVKVLTPEGAIYTHQKIYGEKARIQLTQSDDYVVNCVMMNGVDVTADFRKSDDGSNDGYYESNTPITHDLVITVTMESRHKEKADDIEDVVSDTDINVQVQGMKMRVVHTESLLPVLAGEKLTIKDIKGNIVYRAALPINSEIEFNSQNEGVFFVTFDDYPQFGTFKIITTRG